VIVTFYSYKGGVGRSMALANVAEWLYRQGLRVIIVDWDLEAPGIENFFEHDPEKVKRIVNGKGVVDLLVTFCSAHETLLPSPVPAAALASAEAMTGDGGTGPKPLSPHEKLKIVSDLLPSVAFSLQPLEDSRRPSIEGREPGLWLLSAGARGERFEQYADHVHSFDWSAFYLKQDGDIFFRWLRTELLNFADIVLVDSRTGVTEMSGVCTRDLADLVVSMCAPNDSNLDGVIRMTRWFLDPDLPALREGRELKAIIVPSRVDGKSETDELGKFREKFMDRVGNLRDLDPEVDPAGWWALQIGYVSLYSFHERIVVGRSRESEYLQTDLVDLAAVLAERLLAHAARRNVSFEQCPLGPELRKLVDQGLSASVRAENAFRLIAPPMQEEALAFLTRLVRLHRADEGGSVSAIRVPITAAWPKAALVDALVGVRLVSKSSDASGAIHVGLVDPDYATKWERLDKFVRKDESFILWRQQLGEYLNAYRTHQNSPSRLLAGEVLQEAKRQADSRPNDLTAEELEFIRKSSESVNKAVIRRMEELRSSVAPTAATESPAPAPPGRPRASAMTRVMGLGLVVLGLAAIWGSYEVYHTRTAQHISEQVTSLERDADQASAQGDYTTATGKLDQAIALAPDNPELFLKRGLAKLASSKQSQQKNLLSSAIADFGSALTLDPQRSQALRALADALQRRKGPGDLDQAEADLTKAIALEPKNTDYIVARAKMREFTNHTLDALADYKHAIDINPVNSDALFSRGLLLLADNKTAEAAEDFRNVVKLGGDSALVAAAGAQLQKIAPTVQASAPRAQVFLMYSYRSDLEIVNLIGKDLSNEFDVQPPQWLSDRTDCDVRYFFREDRGTATRLGKLVQGSLASHSVRRSLEVIYLNPNKTR